MVACLAQGRQNVFERKTSLSRRLVLWESTGWIKSKDRRCAKPLKGEVKKSEENYEAALGTGKLLGMKRCGGGTSITKKLRGLDYARGG